MGSVLSRLEEKLNEERRCRKRGGPRGRRGRRGFPGEKGERGGDGQCEVKCKDLSEEIPKKESKYLAKDNDDTMSMVRLL